MNFLENLDFLLKSNKMTRSDLARALNMSPSTINSWYNRSCDGVALKSLVEISKYFAVSLDTLVNGDDIEDYIPIHEINPNPSPFNEREVAQLKRLIKYYEMLDKGDGVL
jgi:transcriptional regulator with XRE-family HTH domain